MKNLSDELAEEMSVSYNGPADAVFLFVILDPAWEHDPAALELANVMLA